MRVFIHKTFVVAWLAFLPLAGNLSAEIWAYTDGAGDGTQTYTGNLGMNFTVNQSIVVDQLGVFNANGTGLVYGGPISVGIFDSLGNLVTPIVQFSTGTTYTLAPGNFDIIQPIASMELDPGNYSIVAVGFGSSDPNGNTGSGSSGPTLADGGGLITFDGYSYDSSSTLDNPAFTNPAATGPVANQFDAGTFEYEATPEPSTLLLFLPAAGLFFLRRKLKIA